MPHDTPRTLLLLAALAGGALTFPSSANAQAPPPGSGPNLRAPAEAKNVYEYLGVTVKVRASAAITGKPWVQHFEIDAVYREPFGELDDEIVSRYIIPPHECTPDSPGQRVVETFYSHRNSRKTRFAVTVTQVCRPQNGRLMPSIEISTSCTNEIEELFWYSKFKKIQREKRTPTSAPRRVLHAAKTVYDVVGVITIAYDIAKVTAGRMSVHAFVVKFIFDQITDEAINTMYKAIDEQLKQ